MPVPCYSSNSHGLTLRELLEVKTEISVLEAKITEQIKAMDRALQIQAKEYERRLEHLNGEQERLSEERQAFLPRERFETYLKEQDTLYNHVNKGYEDRFSTIMQFINEQRGKNQGINLSWTVLLAVVTLGIGIGAVLVHLLK